MKSCIDRVKELLSDDSFLDMLAETQSVDELTQLFHNNGAELTTAQVEAFLSSFAENSTANELTEVELDSVSGGVSVISVVKNCYNWFKKGLNWGGKLAQWEKSLYK